MSKINDSKRLENIDKQVLIGRNINLIYGDGCEKCFESTGYESNNICKYCGSIVACNNVNLELYEGEVLGIVGESGSGKSTLLKILFFQEHANSGEVYISHYNKDTNILELSDQKKRYIKNHFMGIVYQNPHLGLNLDFSSGGNIAEKLLMANLYNVEKIRDRGKELLIKTNIPVERIDHKPKYFSGGMQQRVQIAKALSNNPPILLLDEVTTGLDVSVQAEVLDLIREIQRELKISMIVVSHDFDVIKMLADRTIVMKNGSVIEFGLTDQIMEDPQHPYTQQLINSLL
ncbi:ATP-binding cassette domain-containing protein [Clostridioides difficile]|nr:ATP-binding cassette domain-containing protein [Clostridioides difficile]